MKLSTFYNTILTNLLKRQMKSTAHIILLQSQASGSQTLLTHGNNVTV